MKPEESISDALLTRYLRRQMSPAETEAFENFLHGIEGGTDYLEYLHALQNQVLETGREALRTRFRALHQEITRAAGTGELLREG